MTVKRRYKINYKRLIPFAIAILVICALIIGAVIWFFGSDDQTSAKGTSVSGQVHSIMEGSAIHEQKLKAAISSSAMVRTAVPNIGYKGGKKFWTYCGYSSHIDWCACFVSWCAGQNGYIDSGKMEKFAYVPYGVNWFKEKKRWKAPGYKPNSGNLIFFDWDKDGGANHVGIVEYYSKGIVYTVEGNRDDTCVEKKYDVNSKKILGYGIIKEQ
jgi:hypothetical protein